MSRFARLALFSLALIAGVSSAAQAHRMWLLPSAFTLSGQEQWVTVDGAISNNLFYPNHVPLSLSDIRVTAPDGNAVTIENGSTGKFRSVFDVKLDQQGTYKIAETGGLYFASWEEGGETMRRRGTLEEFRVQGIDKKPGVQLMYSARRVETYVTLGAPTQTVFTSTGKGIEMVPVTHPNDAYAGEEVTFRFLTEGKAADGIEISVFEGADRYRDEAREIKLTTDSEGLVRFTPQFPGRYLVMSRGRGMAQLDGKSIPMALSFFATFDVLTN